MIPRLTKTAGAKPSNRTMQPSDKSHDNFMRQPVTWWDQEESLGTDYCINRGSDVLQGPQELGNVTHVYNRLAVRLLHFIVAYTLFNLLAPELFF